MTWAPRIKKGILGFFMLLLAVTLSIGGTLAWTFHQVSQENRLQSHTVAAVIDETTDGRLSTSGSEIKEVSFRNTGSSAVFLRVAYNESWQSPTEGWLPNESGYAVKGWSSTWGSQWEDGGDGWYYYRQVLPAGASTAAVLNNVVFSSALPPKYQDAAYDLNFTIEAVQASDEAAVNTSATQTVFGRTAAVIGMTVSADGACTGGTVTWS